MQVGLFRPAAVATQPSGAGSFLAGKVSAKTAIDAAIATELFASHDPESISLKGVSFTEDGWKQFNGEVAKSMGLQTLSLAGMVKPLADTPGKSCDLQDLIAALVENSGITRLDLNGLDVDVQLAKEFAQNVVPWNKSILTWNLNGNPKLGFDGVEEFVKAFHDTHSAVQTLSVQGCGISDSSALAESIVAPLLELTGIVSADFNDNEGFTTGMKGGADEPFAKRLSELDEIMKQNFEFLHPGEQNDFQPLSTVVAAAKEEKKEKEKEGARKPRTSMVGKQPPAAQRTRGSSSTQRASSLPPKKKSEPMSRKDSESRKTREDNNNNAGSNDNKENAESGNNTPTRGRSPAPQTPRRSQYSAARSPARNSPSVKQSALDDGTEKWNDVKKQYNEYIRSGSHTGENMVPQKIHRDAPKFCLGKRIETIKNSGASPSFKGGYARTAERAPMPHELRTMAPWNQKESAETPSVPVGGIHRAQTPDGKVLRFVNGGDISCIKDDPRDMGYLARRVKEGMVKPKPSLFMSNAPRELRWGTAEGHGAFMPKQAQAPPIGAYKLKDEWAETAKKLRESSRNTAATGRPVFGSSSTPRAAKPLGKSNEPAPGSYEIP